MTKALRKWLSRFEPIWFRELRHRRKLIHDRNQFERMNLEETFCTIYRERRWASGSEKFDSGSGSSHAFTSQYCSFISEFISDRNIRCVLDLGCGDFRVGQQLTVPGVMYIGIDIVGPLVDYLNLTYSSEFIKFAQLNIVEDELPDADLCLVRQVLQHLSNAEILCVIRKTNKYRYTFITEHVPRNPSSINYDKPHGPDIRIYDGSGVFVDHPPFSLCAETVLETSLGPNDLLRTSLVLGMQSRSELQYQKPRGKMSKWTCRLNGLS